MELSDGTQIQTTDFVAENQSLDEFSILDENVIKRLSDIARAMPHGMIWTGDVLKVWLCHDECTEYWTVGVEYADDSQKDICFMENDCYICINRVKVYIMPIAKGTAEVQ